MVDLDLSGTRRAVLGALVANYESTGEAVDAATVAGDVDRAPGTVRNVMGTLQSVELVESVRGPTGGYRPTATAYDVVDRGDTPAVLAAGYDRLDVRVQAVTFVGVHLPDQCRARLVLREPATHVGPGDAVAVGPVSPAGLLLAGEVVTVDAASCDLFLDVAHLEAPAEPPER